MTHDTAPAWSPTADPTQLRATFADTPQASEELERLRRCANGNTLRFEASTVVEPLVAGGYAKQGIGRVVKLTPKGQEYLRAHATTTVTALQHGDGQSTSSESNSRPDRSSHTSDVGVAARFAAPESTIVT